MSGDAAAALDISDKRILDATRQIRGANDSIQLKYTLPSGRVVTSAPFKADQGAKALIEWCNVIRGQMEADAADERDRVRQKVMEEKAAQARAATGLLIDPQGRALAAEPTLPSMEHGRSYTPPIPATGGSTATAAGVLSSPDQFIQAQLTASREAVERLEWEAQEAMGALLAARTNLQKWEALAAQLVPQAKPATAAPEAPRRKRGRPKKETVLVETPNDDS